MSGIVFLDRCSPSPIVPSPNGPVDRHGEQLLARLECRQDVVSIAWKIDGTAGHHRDVADDEAGSDGDRVVDMGRAFRHSRHALTRVGEGQVARFEIGVEESVRALSRNRMDSEGSGVESAVMSSWVGPMPPVVKI